MDFTLTMTGEDTAALLAGIFSIPGVEGAAYLLCGRSQTTNELRFLVREVVPVADRDYLVREPYRLSIASPSYVAAAKKAAVRGDSIIFVHSHPTGIEHFSAQDDREEPKLMQFFTERLPNQPHGSLVVVSETCMRGRVWSGSWQPMSRIRQTGERLRFVDVCGDEDPIPQFFDRQVRAFGPDIQRLLGKLHIGVVGAGGTGSAVLEQLVRLGVGTISVFDGERFESTNVNRVYGSTVGDDGRPKVEIAERHLSGIGLGTTIRCHDGSIGVESIAKSLRECDIVFGCTDRQAPRGTLVRLALWYLIPVIDVGVKIDAPGGTIRDIMGRVTVLLPGEACLFCRGRISSEMIRLESLSPDEWKALADEEYAPELQDAAPAVIPFTTAVAAQGVSELLHRLTGFMGADRHSSETLMFFHERMVRTNRPAPKPECVCIQRKNWAKGDRRSFLDLMWPDSESR